MEVNKVSSNMESCNRTTTIAQHIDTGSQPMCHKSGPRRPISLSDDCTSSGKFFRLTGSIKQRLTLFHSDIATDGKLSE